MKKTQLGERMRIKFICSLVLLILVAPAAAKAQTEQWVARYNGQGGANSIAVDSNTGNVYVTGFSWGGETLQDYATVAYDAAGKELWFARYNGPANGYDFPSAIAVDSNTGNVYVTGRSDGIGTGYDYATVAYDATGAQLWVARYNGPANFDDVARAIAVNSGTGNVYVTGESRGIGTFDDYATVAYDSNGTELWVARYNGPANGYDIANAIAVDSTGSVYVTGRSEGIRTGYDYATIAYNSTGAEQWVARYNGPGNAQDIATAIAVDSTRNVYVTGWSTGIGTGDFATIKYSQP